MSNDAEVVIVGGGIAGCASAYYLARRGVPALVCEKGEIGGEQSSRNWGFVRQQRRDPLELPLMIACNRMWRGLESELEADLEWIRGGNLALAESPERVALFEDWLEVARQHQLETSLLTRREVEALVPGIDTACAGALYTPGDGQAEPTKVTAAFRRAAERRGATFHTDCAVEAIELERGAVAGVITEKGPIRARTVVCAAGVWSGRLVRALGLSLPQIWMRGTVARTAPAPPVTPTAVWSRVAFRQRRDGSFNIASGLEADHDLTLDTLRHGLRFLPSLRRERGQGRSVALHLGRPALDHLGGHLSRAARARELRRHRVLDPPPNGRRVEAALADLRRTLPALGALPVVRSWAGYIDMTPDMLPVIDRLDRPAGLVLATGFSGHGFGMGPIVGRLVAELILDGKASLDIAGFRFDRFANPVTAGVRSAP